MALNLGSGDEVIVPAFTWVTSAHSAEYVGAKPVFVDIDLSTFNIAPERLEAAITPRTKAIVAVECFGHPGGMVELEQIAQRVSQINEMNLVIASAAEEQAQVAREVDRNLVNIRDLSLQSSAGANQTSAASQELARLAIDLNNLVARFQV